MFSQTGIEKEIAGRVDSRIGKLLGSTLAAIAFARLCELPPVWKPLRQYPARKARYRLELANRILALEASLALGEKERRGASRKVMAGLPERLRSLASVVSGVNRASESPVERLLARAFQASQMRKDADAIAISLSDRARDFLHLPETLRDYAGFVAADDLLATFSGNRLSRPALREFFPALLSAQKVRLLDYVEGWSGSPHYREVARLALRVEGRPDSALDAEVANLKRIKRESRGQIPLAL